MARKRKTLTKCLKDAVRDRTKQESVHSIAVACGMRHQTLYRFLSGDRDITTRQAELLCDYLALTLR